MLFDLLIHLQPFQIWLEMKSKVQNFTKMSICHRTIKKITKNLKCTLRCSYVSSTNHQLTLNPYHWPFMVYMHTLSTTHPMSKITRLAVSQKLLNQQKRKKKCMWVTYFYTFLQIFGSKFKIPIATEMGELFWHLGNWHLMAQQTAERWHTQKSKIG